MRIDSIALTRSGVGIGCAIGEGVECRDLFDARLSPRVGLSSIFGVGVTANCAASIIGCSEFLPTR